MGKCACTEGWEGNACECPKSQQTCLDSKGVSRSRNWAQAGLDGPSRCLSGCGGLCLHRVSAMAEENVCVAFANVQTLVSKWPRPVSQISRCVYVCVCEVVLQTVGVSRSFLTCHSGYRLSWVHVRQQEVASSARPGRLERRKTKKTVTRVPSRSSWWMNLKNVRTGYELNHF